jgi:hypothetical protein
MHGFDSKMQVLFSLNIYFETEMQVFLRQM